MMGAPSAASGHPHGKHSSWLLTATVIAAFIAGGAALIVHLWWLLFLCLGVVVISVPVGKAIRIMDDTVVWGDSPAAAGDGEQTASQPSQAQQQIRQPEG
jgi:hypothetical protein